MTQTVTFDLEVLIVYAVIIVLIVITVLYLCWILGCKGSRDLTEFQVSAKNPAHVLTIRTTADNAKQLMDHLVDRVIIQIDPRPESGAEPEEEPEEESVEELDSGFISESNPNVVTTASVHHSADQDQTSTLLPKRSDVSQYASLSSQGASGSPRCEEESQL